MIRTAVIYSAKASFILVLLRLCLSLAYRKNSGVSWIQWVSIWQIYNRKRINSTASKAVVKKTVRFLDPSGMYPTIEVPCKKLITDTISAVKSEIATPVSRVNEQEVYPVPKSNQNSDLETVVKFVTARKEQMDIQVAQRNVLSGAATSAKVASLCETKVTVPLPEPNDSITSKKKPVMLARRNSIHQGSSVKSFIESCKGSYREFGPMNPLPKQNTSLDTNQVESVSSNQLESTIPKEEEELPSLEQWFTPGEPISESSWDFYMNMYNRNRPRIDYAKLFRSQAAKNIEPTGQLKYITFPIDGRPIIRRDRNGPDDAPPVIPPKNPLDKIPYIASVPFRVAEKSFDIATDVAASSIRFFVIKPIKMYTLPARYLYSKLRG